MTLSKSLWLRLLSPLIIKEFFDLAKTPKINLDKVPELFALIIVLFLNKKLLSPLP